MPSDAHVEAVRRRAACGCRTGIRTSREHVDEMTMFRSCWADGLNHVGSVCQMNTGSILAGRPSMGAWVTYGLGTRQSQPADVRDPDRRRRRCSAAPRTGAPDSCRRPIRARCSAARARRFWTWRRLRRSASEQQRGRLDLLKSLNRHYGDAAAGRHRTGGAARTRTNWRTGCRRRRPKRWISRRRSEATRKLYGMDDEVTAKFGTNCLLARRLVERGVRFVELYSGSGSGWDAHNDLDKNHAQRCQETDVPIAGLLTDLKARGLLDSTLVVWGGEFGRTPFNEKGNGRDHNPWGFTMWMAGGGIKKRPGHRAHRRDRPARRGAPGARARSARDHSVVPRAGSREGDLPAQRPLGAPDHRERRSREGSARVGYIYIPPLTASTWPVMYDASSLARNFTAAAMSSGLPMRARGTDARIFALTSSGRTLVISVAM